MRTWIGVLETVLIIAASGGARGEDTVTLERFLREYVGGHRKLKDYYFDNVIMKITRSSIPPNTSETFEFRSGEGSISRVVLDRTGPPEAHRRGMTASVLTPEMVFKLAKPAPEGRYAITTMTTISPDQYEELRRNFQSQVLSAAAPYSLRGGGDVEMYLDMKILSLIDAHKLDVDGERVVRVEWKRTKPIAEGVEEHGTFDVLPDYLWAVRRFEHIHEKTNPKPDEPRSSSFHGEVTYDGTSDGVPVLRSVRQWTIRPNGDEWGESEEVVSLRPGPASPALFTLDAFGLGSKPLAPSTPIVTYLIAAAIACMAIAIALYVYRSRTTRGVGRPV